MKGNVILTRLLTATAADALTDKFGGDTLCDTLANLLHYRARLTDDFGL